MSAVTVPSTFKKHPIQQSAHSYAFLNPLWFFMRPVPKGEAPSSNSPLIKECNSLFFCKAESFKNLPCIVANGFVYM